MVVRMKATAPRSFLAYEGLRSLNISLLMASANFPSIEKFSVERFQIGLAVAVIVYIFNIKKATVVDSRDDVHIFKRDGGNEDEGVADISLLSHSFQQVDPYTNHYHDVDIDFLFEKL